MNDVRLPKRILNAELLLKRGRRRPRRSVIDLVRDDVLAKGISWDERTIGISQNRAEWRSIVQLYAHAERHLHL